MVISETHLKKYKIFQAKQNNDNTDNCYIGIWNVIINKNICYSKVSMIVII